MAQATRSQSGKRRNQRRRPDPTARFVSQTLRWQRGLLAATVVGVALFIQPYALDSFALPKLAVLFGAVCAVAAVSLARIVITGSLQIPGSRAVWIVTGAFAAALIVSVLVSPAPLLSVIGHHGRSTGLVLYLLLLAVFYAVLRLYDENSVPQVAYALLVAGAVTAGYALLQWLDADPVGWRHQFNPVIAFMGNPNFSSAFLGLTVPLALWLAVDLRRATGLRVAGGALAILAFGLTLATGSIQGTIAACAGIAVVVLARLLEAAGPVRRVGLPVFIGVGAVGLMLFLAGFLGTGPLNALQAKETLEIRTWYWEAAAGMIEDHPVTGVGLDMYAAHYRQYRPEETSRWAFTAATDAPHSVPLGMVANGGILLGLSYLAFVGLGAAALIRGLWRLRGNVRLVVGAFGGAWVAYQVQALVSIDMPPLALAHFALTGALVVLGFEVRRVEWSLPWSPPTAAAAQRTRRRIGIGGGAVLATAALVFAGTVVTANSAAGSAQGPSEQGQTDEALARLDRATDRVPWYPEFWSERGKVLAEAGRFEEAAASFDKALSLYPVGFPYLMNRARIAARIDEPQEVRQRFERLMELDPVAPELPAEYGLWLLSRGEIDRGTELLEEAVAARPDIPGWLRDLGRAYLLQEKPERAVEVLEDAVELNPEDQEAAQLLDLARERAG